VATVQYRVDHRPQASEVAREADAVVLPQVVERHLVETIDCATERFDVSVRRP
jgi:hypothetical protein